jgi:hypothetical protein
MVRSNHMTNLSDRTYSLQMLAIPLLVRHNLSKNKTRKGFIHGRCALKLDFLTNEKLHDTWYWWHAILQQPQGSVVFHLYIIWNVDSQHPIAFHKIFPLLETVVNRKESTMIWYSRIRIFFSALFNIMCSISTAPFKTRCMCANSVNEQPHSMLD